MPYFRESIEDNHTISAPHHAIALPLFPLFATLLSSTFYPKFGSFTVYLTRVTPLIFFLHVLTGGSVDIFSGERR